MLVEPSNFCRYFSYTIECQTIHTCMNRVTLNQLLANCQSSVDWHIDWVSDKYRLRCPLSVYGVLSDGVNRHPNRGCFQHTRFEKCILYHTRFIYLLELNSQLAVSVFSFCLPCLEKGKWPFDRIRIIQMYYDHCRVTSNIMFANAHLYTWVEKGTKNTTQCPPARANEPGSAWSGAKPTNHEVSVPSTMHILFSTEVTVQYVYNKFI